MFSENNLELLKSFKFSIVSLYKNMISVRTCDHFGGSEPSIEILNKFVYKNHSLKLCIGGKNFKSRRL